MHLRKIETKDESERKRKRNTLIASIIMISILVFSTAGYFSMDGDESETVSNETVRNVGDYWVANYGEEILRFTNSPDSAKNVSVGFVNGINSYSGKPMYISSDSEIVSYEIGSNLGRYASRVQLACYGVCDRDLPEKNCTDNLIVFNQSEQNKVRQEDKCVFIDGDMRAVDAFLYRIFGLI